MHRTRRKVRTIAWASPAEIAKVVTASSEAPAVTTAAAAAVTGCQRCVSDDS